MSLLAADFIWFDLIPGFQSLNESLVHTLSAWHFGAIAHNVKHLFLTVFATLLVVIFAMKTKAEWSDEQKAVVPPGHFSIRNLVEMIMDTALMLGEQVLGSRKAARKYLPLIGTLALYILFNNLLGLVPGFAPATDNLNITVGPALVVFIMTHIEGIKEQGIGHYLAHFMGPKIGPLPLLAPLMIPIEIISHLARPLSLSLRLMGNMTGDHAVLAIFLGLAAIPLFYPLPILVLGTIVCVVQTLVFCLLALVYIALAIEHSEEAH